MRLSGNYEPLILQYSIPNITKDTVAKKMLTPTESVTRDKEIRKDFISLLFLFLHYLLPSCICEIQCSFQYINLPRVMLREFEVY